MSAEDVVVSIEFMNAASESQQNFTPRVLIIVRGPARSVAAASSFSDSGDLESPFRVVRGLPSSFRSMRLSFSG